MLSTFNEQSVWFRPIPARGNKNMMEVLFGRLSGSYPNRWRANFQGENAIQEWEEAWAAAFDAECITPNDIALGIQNCNRMFDWPPSLPEFLRACRPYLEANVAFFEAKRGVESRMKGEAGTWSHPAIFYAALDVGQSEIFNHGYPQLKTRWEKALSDQLSLGRWPEIPPVVEVLPAPARTEEGKAQARTVSEMAGKAVASKGKDHKRWAKLILENPEDKCMFAVNAAKTTLGMEVQA